MVNVYSWSERKVIASGILLKSRVVLTTAYWFAQIRRNYVAEDIWVNVGMLNRFEYEPTSQMLKVEEVVLQPKAFKINPYNAPIALLKLATEPKLSYRVRPFGLENIASTPEEDYKIVRSKDDCVVPGFGLNHIGPGVEIYPKHMLKYRPAMWPQKSCKRRVLRYKRSKMLCSRNEDSTTVCMYDHGAPLICNIDGNIKLHGVVSLSLPGCAFGMGLYSRLSTHALWIREAVKMLQRDQE